jgi:hypothetical protein
MVALSVLFMKKLCQNCGADFNLRSSKDYRRSEGKTYQAILEPHWVHPNGE